MLAGEPQPQRLDQMEAWAEVVVRGKLGTLRFKDTTKPPVGIVILVNGREKYILRAKDNAELEIEWYW